MAPAGIGDRLEGTHAVAAAVRAERVFRISVERGRAESAAVARIVAAARSQGVAIDVVDDVRPLAGTTSPQGIVAEARSLARLSLEELVAIDEPSAVLVLDRVEDARNVGAAARSAVAAGVKAMVVARRRAAPLGAAAFKAAAGAFEDIGIAVVSSIADAVHDLRRLGLWTVGLDSSGDRSLFGLDLLGDPVAIVLGAEGSGLSRLVRDRVDVLARIPISSDVESLNVSAAATLALFELARVRGRIT